MGKTNIAWSEMSWNPVTGCTKVSPGCANCYAEALSRRFGRSFEVTLHPERLDEPLHWRKPRRVFVCSMADLFHKDVPGSFINDVWMSLYNNSRHTYQLLTKRPERLEEWTHVKAASCGWPIDEIWPRWAWLGTSIENDRYAYRADLLRRTPAAVRFISAEPLLGPLPSLDLTGIDWLIIGGESGPHARPMDPQWARDLIAAARQSGTAVFVKQMGGLRPGGPLPDEFNIREYPDVPKRSPNALDSAHAPDMHDLLSPSTESH